MPARARGHAHDRQPLAGAGAGARDLDRELPDVVIYPENDTIGVATRHPFVPLAEGEDEGVVGLFRAQDNLRKPAG